MNKVISYHGYGLLRYDNYENGAVLTHPNTNKSETIMSEIGELVSKNRGLLSDFLRVDRYVRGEHDALNYLIPNVGIKIYSSDKPFTLEEADSMLIQSIYGDFDARTVNFGYSEFTVLGFDVERMKIGEHDLIEVFESLEGKYIHFLLDINVDVPDDVKVHSIEMRNDIEEKCDIGNHKVIKVSKGEAVPLIGYVSAWGKHYEQSITGTRTKGHELMLDELN